MNRPQEPSTPQSSTHPLSRHVLWGGAVLLIAGAVCIAAIVVNQRRSLARQAEARRKVAEAGPLVRTLTIGEKGTLSDPMAQGEALPYLSTTLYARASGFLKDIRVDKGSPVRKGQLLAIIEGPEVDRDLEALKADAENKRHNAERMTALLRDKLVSARDAEQAQADARMAEAKLASMRVSRSYQEIRAPFDGVVTQRFVDPGAMVQNASTSSSAQPVLTVAQVERLRVTFYLDQELAKRVKVGDPVRVRAGLEAIPPQQARISRLAGALDPRTRTLTAETDLDNRQGLFLPGASVQVILGKPAQDGFTLPLEAIVQRQGKPYAMLVGSESRATLRPLTLGEDNGQRVRVLQGVQAGDRVVLNPPPGLVEGGRIQVAASVAGSGK